MKKKKKRSATPWLMLAFLIGLVMVLYPSLAEYYNSFVQTQAIFNYAETVATMDTDRYQAVWESALDYNERLVDHPVEWQLTPEQAAAYDAELDIDGTGNMGYIDIPKINVSLPLYHGTEERVLQTSIGHVESTSLPVGSRHSDGDLRKADFGSHCVLSGHRGLPRAKLFSELDKLVEGDVFILTVLDQTLTYEVDQIRIVEPYDLGELVIEDGKDLCTLVTCTPYGVNTQRMLVRGHRVENEKKTDIRIIADGLRIQPMFVAPFIALPILALLIVWMLILTSGWRRRRRHRKQAELKRQIRDIFHEDIPIGEERKGSHAKE